MSLVLYPSCCSCLLHLPQLSTHMHVRIEFCSEAFYHLSPDMRYTHFKRAKSHYQKRQKCAQDEQIIFSFLPHFDKKRIYDLCNDELSIDFIKTKQGLKDRISISRLLLVN